MSNTPALPWWRQKDSGVPSNLWPIYEDFRNFLYVIWKHLNLPDPTPVQYDIASFLQHSPNRCVIEAFRGVGKSWVTSAYVIWELLRDPQKKIMVVSASKERADSFSIFTKRLINEVPILANLRARPDQRNSNIAFDVGPAKAAHAPSVKSVGITGQITGSRADIIIADDVEVPGNSATQILRDKLSEQIKEFDAILTPKLTSKIIFLGTPQSEDSVYNRLPERGYTMRIWPARFPTEEQLPKYRDRLAPFIVEMMEMGHGRGGDPTDPMRFDRFDLEKRALSYGRSGFALQFMLMTDLSDQEKYPLKLNDLIVMSLNNDMGPDKVLWGRDPEHLLKDLPTVGLSGDYFYRPGWIAKEFSKWQGVVMSIDPSGRGADETGYAVIAMLHGQLFVLDAGGLYGGYSADTLEGLAKIASKWQVNDIVIEANFGDGMFTELLKPVLLKHHKCRVEEVKHSKQKEQRIIDTLEPVMNQHRLIFNMDIIQRDYDNIPEKTQGEKAHFYRLFYQMTRITRERGSLIHDDRLDALAIAVAYWTERMKVDVDRAVNKAREERLDQELRGFAKHVLGKSPRKKSWVSFR